MSEEEIVEEVAETGEVIDLDEIAKKYRTKMRPARAGLADFRLLPQQQTRRIF